MLNTGSQFETGFLDDPGHYAYHENIKGALWMGFPGNGNGLEALGEILVGKTNPSGHMVARLQTRSDVVEYGDVYKLSVQLF